MAEGRKVFRKNGVRSVAYDVLAETDGYLWIQYKDNTPITADAEKFEDCTNLPELPFPIGTRLEFVGLFDDVGGGYYEYLGQFGSDPNQHALRYEETGNVCTTHSLHLYRQVYQPS